MDIFNAKKFRTAIVAALNDTCCIFDINGNYIMTPFIGRCKPFENRGNCRFLRIEKKNKDGIVCQGCFDLTQRKFIMNVIYKEITYLSADKYFKVKLNGKYEFINEEGIL